MIRFCKRLLICMLIFYGIWHFLFKVNLFSFSSFKLSDIKKIENSYFYNLFYFLKESGLKKAITLRDGEFLTYSNLNIQHIFDDKTIDLIQYEDKIYDFDCIITNNYNDPLFYNKDFKNILNQYEKSTLIFDDLDYKIFNLKKINYIDDNEIKEFTLNVSKIDDFKKNYLYLTHKDEYPSMTIKPDVNYFEFPVLDNNGYDCICDMEITSSSNSRVFFSIIDYGFLKNQIILKDTFYLKKGKNIISTRFLSSYSPFRCLLTSKKTPIIIDNFKIKFKKTSNKLLDLKQLHPKSYSMILNKNVLSSNEIFYFENSTNKEKMLNLNLIGDGELFLHSINFNVLNQKLLKRLFNIFNNFSFVESENFEISIGQQPKKIKQKIPSNSILFLEFKKNHMNENANFVIQNLEITNESEKK